jgi:glycosyltransferase involved in cell wall biosynthesis
MPTLDLRDKVTIGIPVYNEVRFIRETLESAIIQGVTVIVSDNASTDGTSEICREYANKGLIQYIRHPENQGAWRNFMFLTEKATTPYFMCLGGHDVLAIQYVSSLLAVLEPKEDYLLCASNYYNLIDVEGHVVRKVRMFKHGFCLRSSNAFIRTSYYLITDVFNAVFQGLYRLATLKEYFFKHKNEDICGGVDAILIARLLAKGKIYCSDTIPCGYAVREVRDEESFCVMMQRQQNALCATNEFNPNSLDNFIGAYIKQQIDALGNWCGISYVNRRLKTYIHNKIKKKILLRLLVDEIKLYADGKQDIGELKKQLKLREEAMNVRIPSSVFWDWVSVVCLSPFLKGIVSGQTTLTTYLEVRRDLEQRGLQIPFLRRLKWYLKYVIKWLLCPTTRRQAEQEE